MKIFREIAYSEGTFPARHRGDLFLAGEPSTAPVCLLIHGGGWNAMAKESLEPVSLLFCDCGMNVFSINYRLLEHDAWPACLDDCLAAAEFLLGGGLQSRGCPGPARVVVAGASAGGHLAMMTGVKLGRDRVERVISLAGPVRVDAAHGSSNAFLFSGEFHQLFFGAGCVTAAQITSASPLSHLTHPPDLICIHSKNDTLVPPAHSVEAVEAWRKAGANSALLMFNGPRDLHGFWCSDDSPSRQMSGAFREILASCVAAQSEAILRFNS